MTSLPDRNWSSARLCCLLILSTALGSCGKSAATSPTSSSGGTGDASLSSLSLQSDDTQLTVVASRTASIVATARFSNGSLQDVTSAATWQSSNTSLISVVSPGVVSVLATTSGSATVTATYQGKSASISIVVAVINITGAWSGGYSICCGFSSRGAITLQLTQTGSTFSGTMRLVDSLGLFTVNGTIQGSWSTAGQRFSFTAAVPPDASLGCAFTFTNGELFYSAATAKPTLQGSFGGSSCGTLINAGDVAVEK